jgi:hypothetical protein
MKSISLVVCAAAFAAGCSVNGTTPVTAWGKKDVTMIDYRTDGGQCAVLAATHTTDANGSNTAGGINGQNSAAPAGGATGSATGGSSAGSGGSASNNLPSMGGGTYRDSANPDFVNRAAMQQRSVEMQEQQRRAAALKSCLSGRGYTEFELTAEQRAALSKLPQGSDERREYLYKLGTDPDVLSRQSVKK